MEVNVGRRRLSEAEGVEMGLERGDLHLEGVDARLLLLQLQSQLSLNARALVLNALELGLELVVDAEMGQNSLSWNRISSVSQYSPTKFPRNPLEPEKLKSSTLQLEMPSERKFDLNIDEGGKRTRPCA